MRIGILGSGLMGAKLGTIFARAGHEVTFSYSRSERKLERLARLANAKYGSPRDAARNADAVLVAVHWSKMRDVLSQAGDLSGKVLISCSLPMNKDDTALVLGTTMSGAERLARMRPKARVVQAFNTVPSEVLFGVFAARRRRSRPSLVYCGDDRRAKKVAVKLIRDAGFEPIDAGPLRIARYTEPFALLIAQLAYEGKGGPEVAYRIERF
jgi:predicted dinucleotide-binding enzyme